MPFIDQLNRSIELFHSPLRIVSLVPSQTELLFDLGLDEQVVGVTKFCVHPKEKLQGKTIIGGTKNFNFEKIAALNPDLIIANKEENYKEGLEQLAEDYPVWISDIEHLSHACQMIEQVGTLVGRTDAAQEMSQQIQSGFSTLPILPDQPRVAYLIWNNPIMVAGKQTFIQDMLQRCGFHNPFAEREDSRYPSIEPKDLSNAKLDYILLSSEPFPFEEKHQLEIQKLCPNAQVALVDGEMFSWYGSRLLQTITYLAQEISNSFHPVLLR